MRTPPHQGQAVAVRGVEPITLGNRRQVNGRAASRAASNRRRSCCGWARPRLIRRFQSRSVQFAIRCQFAGSTDSTVVGSSSIHCDRREARDLRQPTAHLATRHHPTRIPIRQSQTVRELLSIRPAECSHSRPEPGIGLTPPSYRTPPRYDIGTSRTTPDGDRPADRHMRQAGVDGSALSSHGPGVQRTKLSLFGVKIMRLLRRGWLALLEWAI